MSGLPENSGEAKKLGDMINQTFNAKAVETGGKEVAKTVSKQDEKEIKRIRSIMKGQEKDKHKKSKKNLKQLKEDLAKIKSKTEDIAKSINVADTEVGTYTKDLEEKKKRVETLGKSIGEATQRVRELKARLPGMKTKLDEVKHQKNGKDAEAKNISEDVANIKEEYDKIEKGLQDAKNTLLELQGDVDAIPEEIRGLEDRITAALDELEERNKRAVLLEKGLPEADSILQVKTKAGSRLRSSMEELASSRKTIEDAYDVYEKVENLPAEIDSLERSLKEALDAIPKRELESYTLKNRGEALACEVKELAEKQERLGEELAELERIRRQYAAEETEIDVSGKSQSEIEILIETQKRSIDEFGKHLANISKEREGLNATLQALKEKKTKLEGIRNEVMQEAEKIKDDLKDYTDNDKKTTMTVPLKLKENIEKNERDIEATTNRITELEGKENELKTGKSKAEKALDDALEEREQIARDKKAAKPQPAKKKGGKTAREAKLERLKDYAVKEKELAKTKEELEAKQLEANASDEAVNALEKEVQRLRDDVKNYQETLKARAEELRVVKNRRVMSWTKDFLLLDLLYPLKELYDSITDEKSKLKVKVDLLRAEENKLSAELAKVEDEVKGAELGVQSINNESAEVKVRIEKLGKELEELRAEKEKREARLREIGAKIPSLENDVTELTEREKDISKRLDGKTKSKKELSETIVNLERDITNLEADVGSDEESLRQHETNIQKMESEKRALEREVETLDKSILKLHIDKQEKQGMLENLKKEAAVTELRIDIESSFK